MKQVAQRLKNGEIVVLDVPEPLLQPHGILVRTEYSLISAGTERAKVELGRSSMLEKALRRPEDLKRVLAHVRRDGVFSTYALVRDRLEKASPLGYSAVGRVVAVGELARGVSVGDRVACAGAGYANHAELLYVPALLCARVPEAVSSLDAAFCTVGAIALQGFRQSDAKVGDTVAVIGLGLLGQIALQLARAAGCEAIGVDPDVDKVELARQNGFTSLIGSSDAEFVAAEADRLTRGCGCDSVVITASSRSSGPVVTAGAIARDRGVVVVVGDVAVDVPRSPYYEKELSLRMSRSYGPGRYDSSYEEYGLDYPIGYVKWTENRNMQEFIRLLERGELKLESLRTHEFTVDEAVTAYDVVLGKTHESSVGVLLSYPSAATPLPLPPSPKSAVPAKRPDAVGIGFVGAGNFATGTLLPALQAAGGIELRGITTASGLSASDLARRHAFAYCSATIADLLADEGIDLIVVASRHDTHADYVVQALQADKNVFVEKPLAMTEDELARVVEAREKSSGEVFVGFNRRYAPFTQVVAQRVASAAFASILIRVNAGRLPDDHWTQLPESGGGRIIGEMCHFIDLAGYMAGGHPRRIAAVAAGNGKPPLLQDSLCVTIAFDSGSVASVAYLSEGDTSLGKERVEVFVDGEAHVIDDFRSLESCAGGKRSAQRGDVQDKGHRAEMVQVLRMARGLSHAGDFARSVESTRATLAAVRSLSTGETILLK